MILNQPWVTWPAALSDDVCDRILALGRAEPLLPAGMTSVRSADVRASRVAWLDDPWLYEVLFPYFQSANWSAQWLFHFQAIERLQFTAYGVGEHYGWHVAYAGLYRKLSLTVQLSEPTDYDGGQLQLERGVPDSPDRIRTLTEIAPRGSVVVFPAFLPHRVTPVTRGERLSLVTWAAGRPFL
jgi:PKHD-type hydroxylase